MKLSDGQRAAVAGDTPCRIAGGFGTGKSTALAARRDRLWEEGRRPLLVHHRDVGTLALDIVRRHGHGDMRLLSPAEQVEAVRRLAEEWPWRELAGAASDAAFVPELAETVVAYQSSFLGDEELFVHADAAGELGTWQELAAFTGAYLAERRARAEVDEGGVLVQASLLLRDEGVCADERDRFDELLVDDYQQASFASARLLTQLVGRGGPVVVAGNAGAVLGGAAGADGRPFERFRARFGAVTDIVVEDSFRSPGVPTLRLVDDGAAEQAAVTEAAGAAHGLGLAAADVAVLPRDQVEAAMGREWALVIVPGLHEGEWPAPRPRHRWFDPHLFAGPDVPSSAQRDRWWFEQERRRFAVACSRATRFLVVTAPMPVSPLVGDLVV